MYRVTRILRETFFGIKTDVRASFLKILTICVTLTTISVGLLLSLQINHTKDHWDSKIDVSVYLCTKISTNARCSGVASNSERDGVQAKLLLSGMVKDINFENRDEAWKRFTERYSTGNITRSVSRLSIPESYRVKLVKGYTAGDIGELLIEVEGVDVITNQRDSLKPFTKALGNIKTGVLAFALLQAIGAMFLVGQSIRSGARIRREELAVMRLVGASKTRIQAPFILQNIIETTISASLTYLIIVFVKINLFDTYVKQSETAMPLVNMRDVQTASLALAAGSVLVAGLFSMLSLRKITR